MVEIHRITHSPIASKHIYIAILHRSTLNLIAIFDVRIRKVEEVIIYHLMETGIAEIYSLRYVGLGISCKITTTEKYYIILFPSQKLVYSSTFQLSISRGKTRIVVFAQQTPKDFIGETKEFFRLRFLQPDGLYIVIALQLLYQVIWNTRPRTFVFRVSTIYIN